MANYMDAVDGKHNNGEEVSLDFGNEMYRERDRVSDMLDNIRKENELTPRQNYLIDCLIEWMYGEESSDLEKAFHEVSGQ